MELTSNFVKWIADCPGAAVLQLHPSLLKYSVVHCSLGELCVAIPDERKSKRPFGVRAEIALKVEKGFTFAERPVILDVKMPKTTIHVLDGAGTRLFSFSLRMLNLPWELDNGINGRLRSLMVDYSQEIMELLQSVKRHGGSADETPETAITAASSLIKRQAKELDNLNMECAAAYDPTEYGQVDDALALHGIPVCADPRVRPNRIIVSPEVAEQLLVATHT